MAVDDRWAVTGGSGFVGSALMARLSQNDIACRGLCRSDARDCVRGDIRDDEALRELLSGATVVVHLAAYVHRAARRAAERAECWSVNVHGTSALLDAMAAVSPAAFLIFVSTSNVYAASEVATDEGAPVDPTTPYGISKLAAEQLFREAIAARRIRGAILRPAMVFGNGAPGNLRRLVSMIRRGFSIQFDKGENRKSLLPVGALVEAIVAVAAHREELNGETFNVAGATLSMRRINEIIAEAIGIRPWIIRLPRRSLLVAGRVVDAMLRWTPLPSAGQMIETYGSNTALSDEKLRSRLSFCSSLDVEGELARAAQQLLRRRSS